MAVIHFLRSCALTLTVSVAAINPLAAQSGIESLNTKIATLSVEAQQLQRELESTIAKRQSAETTLKQSQRDLRDREAELQQLRVSLGTAPSHMQTQSVINEQQRIALAELNIESLQASVTRLESKEEELRQSLAGLEAQKQAAAKSIASSQQRARAQANARAQAAEAELAALREENERLRLAMEEEARRAEEAAAEARLLAELAAKQEQTRLEQEALEAEQQTDTVVTPGAEPTEKLRPAEPTHQEVLDDEPPIYIGDDGMQVVIRSRSIDAPVTMQAIGPNLYRAEVSVDPGRAYFDVRNQRFRGYFPRTEEGPQTFVFLYDTSGENPSFLLKGKSDQRQNSQMVSDSQGGF